MKTPEPQSAPLTPEIDAAGRRVAETRRQFEAAQRRLHQTIWETELAQAEMVGATSAFVQSLHPDVPPLPRYDRRNQRELEQLRAGPKPFVERRSIKISVREPW